MPGDQIAACDRGHRGVLDHLRQRRAITVDQPRELPSRDTGDIVVTSSDSRLGLLLRQLELVLGESRVAQHVREDGEHVVEVLLQAVHRRASEVAAHPGLDERRSTLEKVVHRVAVHRRGAALAHHLADELGQPGLVRRLVVRAGPDATGDADQRQFVVLDQEQL